MQIPKNLGSRGVASWWRPKDDKAVLQGYYMMGGVPWNSRLMNALVDTLLADSSLNFSVKVGDKDKSRCMRRH